ncbi:IPT/TIG domain-containing protein, partial [Chloroflexus sp.]|uniref:IPT/TIG domain-containing protein n=1 Tax=Chloroflexus sp. TaxID=1904827 RepID=UPI002ACE5D0D
GTANVTVFTPGPGGGETSAVPFTITNPAPALTSMSPATATAGGAGFTLTVTGTDFVNGSVVRWNGNDRVTTFVSSTQLTAAIPASDIATAGTANVTVFTPGPGGGETSAVPFTIQSSNPSPTIPTITSVSPNSITVGTTDITLTINGNNFENGAIVRWNGTPLATTFVSATQLTATLPATQRGTAGTGNVTVVNPGGGESSTVTVTIRYHVLVPMILR